MFTETVVVSGMHCNHCVASVTEEIEELVPGVRSVEVDLGTGRTVVTTDMRVGADALVAAVASAGFTATALETVAVTG
jgi:copper chaperone CopZ